MKLTQAETKLLAQIVSRACRSALRKAEFRQALRSGWLSAKDIWTVYRKTLRSIDNHVEMDSWPKYARCVAKKEALRCYRKQLKDQRERNEVPFDETSRSEKRTDRGYVAPNPAELIEQRDLAEKLWRLVDRLPMEQQRLLRACASSSFGDNAVATEAKKLGLARSTAYKALREGLSRLRSLFPEMEP